MVLSAFYPSPVDVSEVAHYLALETPDTAPLDTAWRFTLEQRRADPVATGAVSPAEDDPAL